MNYLGLIFEAHVILWALQLGVVFARLCTRYLIYPSHFLLSAQPSPPPTQKRRRCIIKIKLQRQYLSLSYLVLWFYSVRLYHDVVAVRGTFMSRLEAMDKGRCFLKKSTARYGGRGYNCGFCLYFVISLWTFWDHQPNIWILNGNVIGLVSPLSSRKATM